MLLFLKWNVMLELKIVKEAHIVWLSPVLWPYHYPYHTVEEIEFGLYSDEQGDTLLTENWSYILFQSTEGPCTPLASGKPSYQNFAKLFLFFQDYASVMQKMAQFS